MGPDAPGSTDAAPWPPEMPPPGPATWSRNRGRCPSASPGWARWRAVAFSPPSRVLLPNNFANNFTGDSPW